MLAALAITQAPPVRLRAANVRLAEGATITALEERELVERKPHPTDGRQVNIELALKGAAARKSAKDAKRTWLAQAIAQFYRQEQATLFAADEIVKRLVEL